MSAPFALISSPNISGTNIAEDHFKYLLGEQKAEKIAVVALP